MRPVWEAMEACREGQTAISEPLVAMEKETARRKQEEQFWESKNKRIEKKKKPPWMSYLRNERERE